MTRSILPDRRLSQQPYRMREFIVMGLIAVVVIALVREGPPAAGSSGGSGAATRPRVSAAAGCPSACDNGKRIDNSVCPHLSGEGVEAILQSLNSNSVVWEWGEGSSAVYFAQCVREWNVVISDRQHCHDIQALAAPNVKVRLAFSV